jgi:hypothetical protein
MPNVEPIKNYIAAVKAIEKGWTAEASRLLTSSIGGDSDKVPPVIEHSISKLLKEDTMANDAMLKLLSTEVSKRSPKHE